MKRSQIGNSHVSHCHLEFLWNFLDKYHSILKSQLLTVYRNLNGDKETIILLLFPRDQTNTKNMLSWCISIHHFLNYPSETQKKFVRNKEWNWLTFSNFTWRNSHKSHSVANTSTSFTLTDQTHAGYIFYFFGSWRFPYPFWGSNLVKQVRKVAVTSWVASSLKFWLKEHRYLA